MEERLRTWVDDRRKNSGRTPRRYASLDEAIARMAEQNPIFRPSRRAT
uniref:Uncharacterized protein n=1 Tax=Phenylobacterium glaciei TaxID=2803784 RepID=A0A974P2B6_9CAUL|nr:hypothetical protein JKL49_20720 [Phenylobacterium glaciei]